MNELAKQAVDVLMNKNMTLATAESCTGGLLGAMITSVPGVSALYAGGFITYSAQEKHNMLDIPRKLLREQGTVSKKTAKQMAEKAAEKTKADVALSVTGNAGPSASEEKPVGLVYIGCCIDGKTIARKFMFEGSRESIREQAAEAALALLLKKLAV